MSSITVLYRDSIQQAYLNRIGEKMKAQNEKIEPYNVFLLHMIDCLKLNK